MVLRSDSVQQSLTFERAMARVIFLSALSSGSMEILSRKLIQKFQIHFSFFSFWVFFRCKIVRILFVQLLLLLRIDGAAIKLKRYHKRVDFQGEKKKIIFFFVWASVNSYQRCSDDDAIEFHPSFSSIYIQAHLCDIYVNMKRQEVLVYVHINLGAISLSSLPIYTDVCI